MRPVEALVIDYGVYPLPHETARSYDRVPKRKGGEPDRRTKGGRAWAAYVARQNHMAAACYADGGDDFTPEPWRWG
jgi:hypothetical protein